MANDKKFVVKKGLATPNVDFANGGGSISATFLSTSNTLSFSGNTGQLFSITDSMSGTIFSVNDISGIPSIEVIDTGSVKIAETFGTVAIGANTASGYKFYVSGNTLFGNSVTLNSTVIANGSVGTSGFVLTSNGTGVYWAASGGSANNATYLQGRTWETAGAIGSTVANTGAFTSLTASANVNIDSGTLFTDATNNRVGIGNTNPSESLQVDGRVKTSTGGVVLGDTNAVIYRNSNNLELITYGGYGINLMPAGNVGIGSTTAPTKLYVNGHMSVANGFGIYANGVLGANGLVLTSNGTSLFWGSIAAAANATFATTANNALFANSASFVYGKQESQLSVANSAALQGATWQAPLGIGAVTANTGAFTTLTASANVNIDSGTLFTDATNNRVGIGNTNPTTSFHVQGGTLIGGDGTLNYDFKLQRLNGSIRAVQHDFAAAANSPWILHGESLSWTGERSGTVESTQAFRPYYEAFAPAVGYKEFGFVDVTSGSFTGSNLIPNLVLTSGGNVAIGSTTAPTKLYVNGHMSVANGFGIYANGVLGTAGFVLTSNGSSLYWANASSISGTVTSANNSTYAYGKQESQLSVAIAANATFATTANNALFANAAAWLGGFQSSYYTNATNISTGTLAEPRLPFRMDQNVRTTDNVTFANLTITGSVLVTGNVTTWSSNNLSITDNMIYLNSNSSVANPDLGFAANYNDGTYRHAGFFRDATDGVWKVFDQYLPEPDASPYINTANLSFRIADFQANVVNAASVVINNAQAYKQIDGTGTIRTLITTLSDSSVVINGYQGTAMINGVNGATYFYGSGAGSTVMTLTTGGNAGIGNTTPGQRLQVDGSVGIKNGLVANGTFGTNGHVLTSNGTAIYWAAANANISSISSANNSTYLDGRTWATPFAIGSTVANTGAFTTLTSSGVTKIGEAVTQAAPSATDILSTAHASIGGQGSNYLSFGQYSGTFTQWIQSSFVNPTTASYNIALNPLGGNVSIGSATAPTKLYVNGHMSVANGYGIYANGVLGANGLVLTSNGSSLFWGSVSAGASGNNANYLQDRTWETAGAIGSTVANTGTFTTLTASTISLNGNTTFNTSTFAINPTFKAYREAVGANTVSTASTVIDVSTFNVFNLSMTLNTTVSFTNPPASGTAYSFMLFCKQDGVGSRTITWPASVKWPNSSVPTMSTGANKIDVFNFFTLDGGTTYLGALSLANTG